MTTNPGSGERHDQRHDQRHDERFDPRFEGRLEAELLVEGGLWRCWIRDLSLGGAGLEPPIPAALGKKVELRSRRFNFEGRLRGRVVNLAHRRTCVAFDLDPGTRQHLTAFLLANVEPS
jgi:PilZ domain